MVKVDYLKESKTFSPQEISSMVLMKVIIESRESGILSDTFDR